MISYRLMQPEGRPVIVGSDGERLPLCTASDPILDIPALAHSEPELWLERARDFAGSVDHGKAQESALKDEEKAFLLEQLLIAREEGMDGASTEEKNKIFDKYKGRINNYLSKRGYTLGGKKPTTKPSTQPST